ncbi:MAG: DUF4136 domain-containing protein [Hyphomicrobiales bacterium]|nr:DUF4136 domain-containing protein [Hyphomicrobiales bacterium]MCP5373360.1 DUF4136 domain-containing protein [Hyphomicrobiales bacterium]
MAPIRLSAIRAPLVAFLALFLVGACAQTPQTLSEVSRFHALGPNAGGRTFAVAALDQARKDDLEFRNYAARIETALRGHGFRPVAAGAEPDLIAFVNYGIDAGTPVTSSSPRYHFEPGGYHTYTGHIRTAAGLQPYVVTAFTPGRHVYAGERTVTRTVYGAFLTLDLVERASLGTDSTRKVFEGRVVTSTRHPLLPTVMPAMVRALFHQFPGRSGETYTLPSFDPPAD